MIISILIFFNMSMLFAEDGSKLWLRAKTNAHAQVFANNQGPAIDIALDELRTQCKGSPVQLNITKSKNTVALGKEGFTITGNKSGGFTVSASTEAGMQFGGEMPVFSTFSNFQKYLYHTIWKDQA